MTRIGIRDLKLRTSKIVQAVEREQESFEVTIEGEAIAVIEPVPPEIDSIVLEEIWNERRQLVKEFGKNWRGDISVAEAVSQQRR